jgi:hypothetical protein
VLDKKKVRSKVWRPKPKTDDGKNDKPQADINMVVFLPNELMAPVDSDVCDEVLGMDRLILEPTQAIFEKPEDAKRPLLTVETRNNLRSSSVRTYSFFTTG